MTTRCVASRPLPTRHRRRSRTNASSAFTLVEVMLALTILAIVAVTVYGTFSRTLRSKGIVEEQIDVTHAARSALGRMVEEIASAFPPESGAEGAIFRGLSGGTESAPLDALVFSGLSARPSGSGAYDCDQRITSYFFAQLPARPRSAGNGASGDDERDFFAVFGQRLDPAAGVTPQRLLRRETVMVANDDALSGKPVVFLDNVASLAFRFHDGNEWLDTWDSEDRVAHYRRLPRAVAIDLALYDARGLVHHFATAVDLALADPRPGPARRHDAGSPRPRPAERP